MHFSRSSGACAHAGASTTRFTIVGAAKKRLRGQARSSAKISSASNPPDSGITFTAPRATCGTTYRPEPCDSGAGCRIASPGAIASTSVRKHCAIASRLACAITTPLGRPVVPLV